MNINEKEKTIQYLENLLEVVKQSKVVTGLNLDISMGVIECPPLDEYKRIFKPDPEVRYAVSFSLWEDINTKGETNVSN